MKMKRLINPQRTVPMADYVAYRALKDHNTAIEGYERRDCQFEILAKFGGIYEAIDLMVGSHEVEPLVTALRELEVGDEVKTGLQKSVVRSILGLGAVARRNHRDETKVMFQKAREYAHEFPNIAEDVGRYFLLDEQDYSKSCRSNLRSDEVSAGIELLLQSGRTPDEVAGMVLEGAQKEHGKRSQGSMHKVKHYVYGLNENAQSARQGLTDHIVSSFQAVDEESKDKHAQVYGAIDTAMLDILTPEVLEDALRELTLSPEDYEKEKPAVDARGYTRIKERRKELDGGTKYEKARKGFEFVCSIHDSDKTRREKVEDIRYENCSNSRYEQKGEDWKRDWDLESIMREVSPVVKVLDAFEGYLSSQDFETRGYSRIREQVNDLITEVEDDARYIRQELTELSEKLLVEYRLVRKKKEVQEPSEKQSWYAPLTNLFRKEK